MNETILNSSGHHDHRSMASLCQYMSEMRCDITVATKEVMREASSPALGSLQNTKRIARCHKERRTTQMQTHVPRERRENVWRVVVDSDRCSTSSGVKIRGHHFVEFTRC